MLQGIFAPIPTPFLDDESIAYEHLRANLAKWSRTPLHGLVVLGSNGEAPFVDEGEKIDLIAFVRENFPRSKTVIAGTGCESTRATIRLTKEAARAGADYALVINPYYFKASLKDEALEKHYFEVADASPIPILIYNMPGNTGLNMTSGLIRKLAVHPNIAGIKDSGGNIVQISEIIRDVRSDFAVFAGSASFLLPTLVMGGRGGTLASANVVPELCVAIYDAFYQGKLEEAVKLQKSIIELNTLVTSKYGVAGLKAALDMIGYYGGPPRKPVLPVGESQKEEIKKALSKLNMPLRG